jgi:hypothetical protein
MKGLQFLLQSFGINIDPAQIELAFQQGKDSLPKIAQAFDELNSRMSRIEAKMELLLSRTSGEVQPDPVHSQIQDSMNADAFLQEIYTGKTGEVMNGR